jgi:hypothetical protein
VPWNIVISKVAKMDYLDKSYTWVGMDKIPYSEVGGPFFTPKCITTHTKALQSITKAILYWFSNAMEI